MDLLARRRMMMGVSEEPVVPIQIVQNGDFGTGTTYRWNVINKSSSIAIDNGSLLMTIVTAGSSSTSRGVYNTVALLATGHIYYSKIKLVTSYNGSVRLRTSSLAMLTMTTTAGVDGTFDNVKEYTGTNNQRINIYSHYGKASTVGQTMRLYSAMMIDLTATFGAGNEPDLDRCRRLFPLDYYDYNTGN